MSFTITSAIAKADAQGRYLSSNELQQISEFQKTAQNRLRISEKITKFKDHIVKKAGELLFKIRMDIISPGGNAYGEEMTAICLRDLDYYLRLITYGIVAGDVALIYEIGLVGLREMYQSLGTSIPALAEGIYALKIVTASLLSQEEKIEADIYFDYLINSLDSISLNSSQAIEQLFEQQDHIETWEPSDDKDFLNLDKLAQQLQKNGVDDSDAFEMSAVGFFEAWSRMPSELKRKVWREREVMAELCEKMNSWKEIPGFLSVGVAQRMIDGKEQLVGILNFEASDLPREQYYKKFDIPTYLKVESSINPTECEQQELIPIVIEPIESLVKYNSSNIDSAVATSKTPPSKIASSPVLTLQSGDVIVGQNENERFNESQTVTLTTFAFCSIFYNCRAISRYFNSDRYPSSSINYFS